MKLTNFWKCNELAIGLTCLVDEVDGFLDSGFQVEPSGFGSHDSGFVLGERHVLLTGKSLAEKNCFNGG